MSQGFTSPLTLPLPVASGGTGVANSNWTAGSLTFSPTTQGIVGTTTNNDASAGYVGEYITSNIPLASAVACTSGVNRNVTSISLTAGDWDIFGNVLFTGSAVTNPNYFAWCSVTSASFPNQSLTTYNVQLGTTLNFSLGQTTPYLRVSVSSTTTVYLSCQSSFSAGSMTACGSIFARRVR